MSTSRRPLAAAVRSEQGFGLIELLIAMTVLSIGISAVFSMFLASELTIRRAAASTTAMALLDVRMEALRGVQFAAIGHTTTALAAADSIYTSHASYAAPNPDGDAALNETGEAVTVGTGTLMPTSIVKGADGRTYRVDLFLKWVAVSGGRNVKQATIVVRESATPYSARARATALFDQSSG